MIEFTFLHLLSDLISTETISKMKTVWLSRGRDPWSFLPIIVKGFSMLWKSPREEALFFKLNWIFLEGPEVLPSPLLYLCAFMDDM